MEPVLQDNLARDRAREFEEFLSGYRHHDYPDDILTLLNTDATRLLVNIDDVRQYRRELAEEYAIYLSNHPI